MEQYSEVKTGAEIFPICDRFLINGHCSSDETRQYRTPFDGRNRAMLVTIRLQRP